MTTGIIPACAGFTRHRAPGPRPRGDHPRSRGVYGSSARTISAVTGSSPLARGLRQVRPPAAGAVGIIPARAGFTEATIIPDVYRGDHPRSRGVYTCVARTFRHSGGSSPLARGLQIVGRAYLREGGIIPARAGFTPRLLHRRGHRRDHPRSRGVYRGRRSNRSAGLGSSPLARGLLNGHGAAVPVRGIIPARAGFTPHPAPTPAPRMDHPRSRGVYRWEWR